MLFKGFCDIPRLGMHMFILVQTSRGNFVVVIIAIKAIIYANKDN